MPEGKTWKRLHNDPEGMKYQRLTELVYYSSMFNRYITIPAGRKSDGATGARDLGVKESGWRGVWAKFVQNILKSYGNVETEAWWVHDELCLTGAWDDGTKISNFICSTVVAVELQKDGYTKEAIYWWFATFLFGGGKARNNGLLWIKKKDSNEQAKSYR
ncbi:MAG: hypothetical protein ACI8PB_002915 [Desulforhopalus sp.]|jgi:hypothetical protein